MKRLLISMMALLGGCGAGMSVRPTSVGREAAWVDAVVDRSWEEVVAHLGAPVSRDTSTPGVEVACFSVRAPSSGQTAPGPVASQVARCVTFVGGVALYDQATAQVAPEGLAAGFQEALAGLTRALGAPDRRVQFTFVRGRHVEPRLGPDRVFMFGEGCILQAAMQEALAANPGGIPGDAPELAQAVASGTACFRAEWEGRAILMSRSLEVAAAPSSGSAPVAAAPSSAYALSLRSRSRDAARHAAYEAAMAARFERFRQRRQANPAAASDGASGE
jgi:hypothetical protein